VINLVQHFQDLLENIREHFEKPVHINSAFRTESWNMSQWYNISDAFQSMIAKNGSNPTQLKGLAGNIIDQAAKQAKETKETTKNVQKVAERTTKTAGARFGEGATKPGKNGYTGG
jgi:hypothetical protein